MNRYKKKVKLKNAPIGLFEYNGTLCIKTEYGSVDEDEQGRFLKPDAYILSTGEYFWGGTTTSRERNNLLVTPLSNTNFEVITSSVESMALFIVEETQEWDKDGNLAYWGYGAGKTYDEQEAIKSTIEWLKRGCCDG